MRVTYLSLNLSFHPIPKFRWIVGVTSQGSYLGCFIRMRVHSALERPDRETVDMGHKHACLSWYRAQRQSSLGPKTVKLNLKLLSLLPSFYLCFGGFWFFAWAQYCLLSGLLTKTTSYCCYCYYYDCHLTFSSKYPFLSLFLLFSSLPPLDSYGASGCYKRI